MIIHRPFCFMSNIYNRKSLRLPHWDYTSEGLYYVTMVTKHRECLFGYVKNGEMIENDFGTVVRECWDEIPNHFDCASTDAFIVMPNHMHGIIVIHDVGARHAVPLRTRIIQRTRSFGPLQTGSLHTVVGSFKSAVTKQINELRNTPGQSVWQRNYYEHVIRDEVDLHRIRTYIKNNPSNWQNDELNDGP